MTAVQRTLPSFDSGATLPYADAIGWQDIANASVGGLWDRVACTLSAVAGSDAITATCTPPLTALRAGMAFWFTPADNTAAAPTLNVDGQGAVEVRDSDRIALGAGALIAGRLYILYYDGSYLIAYPAGRPADAGAGLPSGYLTGYGLAPQAGDPVNTIVVNPGAARSSDGTADIVMTVQRARVLNVAASPTGGGTGAMLVSANLAGTIDVAASSAAVTGHGTSFTTDFIVGDCVTSAGGQCRRITAITSDTAMTVESNFTIDENGVAYVRGGKARNSAYRVFTALKGGVGTVLPYASLRDVPVDLPPGFSALRRIGYVLTDAAAADRPFTQTGNYFELVTPITDFDAAKTFNTGIVDSAAPPLTIARYLVTAEPAGDGLSGDKLQLIVRSSAATGVTTATATIALNFTSSWVGNSTAIVDVPLDADAQFVMRLDGSGTTASLPITMALLGWFDMGLRP